MISEAQFRALRQGLRSALVSDAHATAAVELLRRWSAQFDLSLVHRNNGGVRLAGDIPLSNPDGLTVLVVAPMETKLKLSFHKSAQLPEEEYDPGTRVDLRSFRPISIEYDDIDRRLGELNGFVAKCVHGRT